MQKGQVMEIRPVGQQPLLVENGQKVSAPQVHSPQTVSKGVGERADRYSISGEAQSLHQQDDSAKEAEIAKEQSQKVAASEAVEIEKESVTYANEQAQAETISPMIGDMTLEQANELKRIQGKADKVVSHEGAHAMVGGTLMLGGPAFQYELGPDGEVYEASGQSRIDMSPLAGNPQATIFKMQHVKRAAMAPLNPSGADRVVASQADQIENQARNQLKSVAEKVVEQNLIGVGGESAPAVQDQANAEWRAKRMEARKRYDYMGDGVPSEALREDAMKGYARVNPVGRPAELTEQGLKKVKA
jgi:hypothetical protein